MNNINKKLSVLLTALMVSFSTSVLSFEGFSVGAVYNSMDFSTTGSEATGLVDGTKDINTTTKTGSADVGSYFAEYTFSQGSTIGIEQITGDAEIGKGSRTTTGATDGTVNVKATISDPTTFYVEPTFMFNEKFGVYVKGGATTVSVKPSTSGDTALVTSTHGAKDIWGVTTGIGAKYYMGRFFVKAEYMETEFEKYHSQSTSGDESTVVAELDTEETRFAIGKE